MVENFDADELRQAIRDAGGVAKVSRAAKIKAQTLYSFMTGATKHLRGDTRDAVMKGLQRLSGDKVDRPAVSESEFETIPIYDIDVSAGDGAFAEDGGILGYQPFRAQQLTRVTTAPLERLAVIMVRGDSMDPTLANQDHVLVDTTVNRVGRDGIYILALEDELLVKRCWIELDSGDIIVKSDNPQYGEQRVTDKERIDVKGRVVWIGRALG